MIKIDETKVELFEKTKDFLQILYSTCKNHTQRKPLSNRQEHTPQNEFNIALSIDKLEIVSNAFKGQIKERSSNQNALSELALHIQKRVDKIVSKQKLMENNDEMIEPEKLVRLSKNITETCQKLLSSYNKKGSNNFVDASEKGKLRV